MYLCVGHSDGMHTITFLTCITWAIERTSIILVEESKFRLGQIPVFQGNRRRRAR
jgi:hypothetical protein